MRKKIINGLLLAVAFVAISTALVSCRDYESDNYAELRGQIDDNNYLLSTLKAQQIADLQTELANLKTNAATKEELEDSIAAVTKELNDAISKLNNCDCAADRQELHNLITNLQNTKADLADMLAADALLQTAINNLANDLAALAAKEHSDSIDLAKAIEAANQAAQNAAALAQQAKELAEGKADTAVVNALAKDVETLKSLVVPLNERLTKVEADAAEALALATRDSIRLDVIEKGIEDALKRLTTAEGDIDQLQADMKQAQTDIAQNAQDLADAKQKYDNALKVINEALASLQSQINDCLTLEQVQSYMTPIVNALQNQIDAVTDDLANFKKKFDEVIDDLSNQIKNIVLQGTESPVVGYFALPVGIQSNILAAYYGEPTATNASGEVEFPTDRPALYVFSDQVISANAFKVIGGTSVITKNAYNVIMDEDEGNAGTLYLTINPAEKDFTGVTPKLVDSRDNESGITLSAIKPSSKALYFGFTRDERVYNGFYEAKATVDPAKVNDIKPSFNLNDLKPLAKQVLNKEFDLTNIYYTIQDQLKDVLVRNGVKVEWTDTLGAHSVYSGYDVAATAIPAISYNFLSNGTGKSIPTITPIGALDIDVDLNLEYSTTGTITVNPIDNKAFYVDVEVGGVTKRYYANGVDEINAMIDEIEAQVDVVYANLSTDVNTLISQIEKQVNDNLGDVEDDLNDRFIGRVNDVIKKVNSAISKLNRYFENPNHLLQPFLAFESEGSYHHMSMSQAIPSEFKFAGGNAIELIPTSYTAEMLAPAFKKFVAVTNVISPDQTKSAQAGDATCQALADYANNTENFMNTVIPGKQTGIVFAPDASHKEGYIYEITYAAVDYTGYNVARKFYVRVK